MQRSLILLMSLAWLFSSCAAGRKLPLPDELREVSGLYVAAPDSLWWLNDSGDAARLILTDGRGQLRRIVAVPGAVNRDWEDLTADPQGRIYIGDFGNNLNRRQDLCIYRFDPREGALDSITFRYPDQERFPPPPAAANFDCEGFFFYADSLHLFSKNRLGAGNYYTKHYVLPARPGAYTAELRDSLYLRKRVVTSAAVAPDGQTVALLSYWFKPLFRFIPLTATTLFFLDDFPDAHFLRGRLSKQRIPKGLPPTQYESVDFLPDGRLLIASERTVFFRQKARRWRRLP